MSIRMSGAFVILLTAGTCSCAAMRGPTRYVETNSLTLPEAICEVQNALIATRRANPEQRAGLAPQKVIVVLALSAGEKNGSNIGVKLPVGIAELTAGDRVVPSGARQTP